MNPSGDEVLGCHGHSEGDGYFMPEESHKRENFINNAILRGLNNCSPQNDCKNCVVDWKNSRKIAFTEPSRGMSGAKVEQTSAETLSFRCVCERCRLTRGEVRKTTRKVAFTLAEVLITLGIIGVVAALTLPTLIKNYQKQVTLNKIKRTYTVLSNTLERAKSDYGTDVSSWYIPDGTNREKSVYFVENYMLPYLKVLKYCKEYKVNTECGENALYFAGPNKYEIIAPAGSDFGTNFILNDGTNVYVNVGSGHAYEPENTNRVFISFDIDGVNKGLNTYGYDIFKVELGGYEGYTAKNNADKNRFLPYIYEPQKNCEYYVGSQPHACSKNAQYAAGSACLAYIVCNGWNFGKNYPW